ncbi:LacI family transcriptional regulator [Actinomadura madurae]|uniref:LacI family DNA-binding transcriptional regulator n=1 Tax=Actinomadura madurae TaxID=1993 RepID=UPI0020261986|nr:LacI family DNA-binding transcriptional regulator [Actinomadura madurae]URM93060.1 LacI family transcriptional regulator [Actinomadura madurae]URN03786.1 LacI family transcriptional regulator [Actinomadura madurae]
MTPRRRATLRDIAAALDLSVNTVSRALAGKDAVSPETRERVRSEAERLGYVPNTMARSLVQGNAMTIGLVITNPSNPFYARLISAIEERGRVHGYALMLMVTEDSVENERRVVDELMRWGVDGVLAVPVQHGSDHWERLRKSGTPVVLLNRDLPELDTDLVGVDYYDSARRATEHLVAGGARDLYLVEEDLDISPVAERVRGFRTVLDEHGVTVRDDHMVKVPTRRREASSQPWDPVDSYEIGRELAARIEPGAAVLAGNDYFALGVYRAFTEHGLRIPGDVRIAGHGDHAFAAYLAPPLSTVRLPAADVGATAVDRLLERMSGEAAAGSPRQTLLPAELVVRASSRAGGG